MVCSVATVLYATAVAAVVVVATRRHGDQAHCCTATAIIAGIMWRQQGIRRAAATVEWLRSHLHTVSIVIAAGSVNIVAG